MLCALAFLFLVQDKIALLVKLLVQIGGKNVGRLGLISLVVYLAVISWWIECWVSWREPLLGNFVMLI
jgi:hypothetical protein